MRGPIFLLVAIVLLASWRPVPADAAEQTVTDAPWFSAPPRPPAVQLYFFWSGDCPHCLQARPFVESLEARFPWILVHSLEVIDYPENRDRFEHLAALAGTTPRSVPTFIWCGQHRSGFADAQGSGVALLAELAACYRERYGETPSGLDVQTGQDAQQIPWLGGIDVDSYSLPTLALMLGALDAFNPCAFFVLLFLLSLLVNTRSRSRMLLVGTVFVLCSGLVYFAFMAAWLNLFQVLGGAPLINLVAGLVALVFGLLNIKDWAGLDKGPSLGISATHKASLFTRMRGLLDTERLPAVLAGTLTLALAANTYELLCTAGLPMVFTRVVTLRQLPELQYYGYLALYNLVYVLPLAGIVGLFVATMGRRKLQTSEGRFLKLLSGIMMGGLGLLLLVAPEWLFDPLTAIGLIVVALLTSLGVHRLARWSDR